MEWFKRSSGLKIFIAIWLLVLLVPILRLRASRQWESHGINFYNVEQPYMYDPNSQFGLSTARKLEVARKFPHEAAAQLVVDSYAYRLGKLGPEPLPLYYKKSQLKQNTEDYFNRYAQLAQQFPHDINVRKQWIRDAVRGELQVESYAQYLTYYPKGGAIFYANGKPIPRQMFLSLKQREAALSCALEGEKIEPDNVYWPWMSATFSFSLRRDKQAIVALQRAAKCTTFDDGISDSVRRSIAMMRRNQHSDWEDDYAVYADILLPHLGSIRSVARAAMWQAGIAQKSGDSVRAIQIANAIENAAIPIARSQDSVITKMVGEALCSIAWRMTLENAGIKIPKYSGEADSGKGKKLRRAIVGLYANYVSEHGYADYGQRAVKLQKTFNGMQMRDLSVKPEFDGISQKTMSIKQFHWLLSYLITIVFFSSLVWLVTWVLTCRSTMEKTIISRTMVKWAALCIGIMVAILLVGANEIIKDTYDTLDPFIDSKAEQYAARQGLNYWLSMALIVTSVIPVLIASYPPPRFKWDGRFSSTEGLKRIRFIIYAGLSVGVFTTLKIFTEPNPNTILGQFWPLPLYLSVLSAYAASIFHIVMAKGLKRSVVVFFSGGFALLAIGFFFSGSSEPDIQHNQTFIMGFGLCFLIVGIVLICLEKQFDWGEIGKFFLRSGIRVRILCAALAVTFSLFYLAVTLASIPARRDIQYATDRQLKIGEVAYFEEKVARH